MSFWGPQMSKLMLFFDGNPGVMPGYGTMTLSQLHDALEVKTKCGVSGSDTPEDGADRYLDWFAANGYEHQIAFVRGEVTPPAKEP